MVKSEMMWPYIMKIMLFFQKLYNEDKGHVQSGSQTLFFYTPTLFCTPRRGAKRRDVALGEGNAGGAIVFFQEFLVSI